MANIATPSASYRDLEVTWAMIQALLDGTGAMREAGERYLPRHPKEEIEDYRDRLKTATLTPFFRKTVSNLVGRIFAKPIALQRDVPESIQAWCENADRQGNHLNVFLINATREAVAKGSSWIMVDYPRVGQVATLAEERMIGARPYLTLYNAESLLYAKVNETGILIEARVKEVVAEPEGEFGEVFIRQIRRLIKDGPGVRYQIWRATDTASEPFVGHVQGVGPSATSGTSWYLYEEGGMTIDEIPLVPIMTNRVSGLISPPPLLDLAYLCVKHWQDQSAQDNVAGVARYPMLAVSGWNSQEDQEITVGPRVMLSTSDSQGRFYYVEHSGAAIAAGRAELERLETQIATEGVRPLTLERSATGATATQIASEDMNVRSVAEIWGETVKDAAEKCLSLMAKWAGLGEDNGGSVVLDGDFNSVGIDAAALSQLQQMRSSGDLSRSTLWAEMRRRGVLADEFDPEAEDARLSEEGPRIGAMPGPGDDSDADES